MTLKIFRNELDASDFIERDYKCLLTEWLSIREQYPTARLYKDSICVKNDLTPKTREQAWELRNASGHYQVLCHAKDPLTLGIVAAVLPIGTAVYTYMNMPQMGDMPSDVGGSPNNSLAQRQNKHRVNGRVADIYGKQKSTPDLVGTVVRYYKDNVQTEECILSIGTGFFDIDESKIKEGDTPVNKIEGASVSIYEPGQSIISDSPQIVIGQSFTELPIVAKQVSSIDGKQTLIPPNNDWVKYNNVVFNDNRIAVTETQSTTTDYEWSGVGGGFFERMTGTLYADFTRVFTSGEQVIISNAIFGNVGNANISGNTDIGMDGVLTIATKTDITNPDKYQKISIASLLVNDTTNGSIDLAGDFVIESLVKIGSTGAYIYEITLRSDYTEVNSNFSLLTADGVSVISAVLTDNDDNIDLSGTYTIASVDAVEMTLVDPASVNPDWNRLGELTAQQTTDFLTKQVEFRGSKENYIGWYYAGNQDSTGFILNFLAANGLFDGDNAKQVAVEIEYQMVEDGIPVGPVMRHGEVMQGIANNRNPVGKTIKRDLPTAGPFRFRAKRANDNGDGASLIDDVIFESAYSYYESKQPVYPYDTIVRLRRMAIGSGTNASEFNLEVHRKLNTPSGFTATSSFADIVPAMATDPFIGRMSPSEVDSADFQAVAGQIAEYFGTDKACEFNYTFDDKYASYQEMVFTVAGAVFCTARRENGQHFFKFERETPNSLLLFNHRNIKPESLSITEHFGIPDGYDGVELKWRNPNDNYSEAVIKLPDDLQTNYKTIEVAGVTNYAQAHFLAHRAWNTLRYSRKSIEFVAYGEADLVTRKDRVAVVDSTVPILCSGEVDQQDATILTLGYPVNLEPSKDYVIQLQIKEGYVDVINIVRQIDDYQIEISRIPLMPLITSGAVHTTFNIVEANDVESNAFVIEDKSSNSLFESTITASSYDSRTYKNDSDFIKGLITV